VLERSASDVAHRLGWSAGVIGLTVVAIGTSTPLIALSIHAA
jgi:Ca2+/Na+ antiporter